MDAFGFHLVGPLLGHHQRRWCPMDRSMIMVLNEHEQPGTLRWAMSAKANLPLGPYECASPFHSATVTMQLYESVCYDVGRWGLRWGYG